MASAGGRDLEAALAKLGKQLRAVGSLPLKVVALQPLSAAARHTAAFPPLPHPLLLGPAARPGASEADMGRVPRCLEAVHLLVQLEGSGELCSLSSRMYGRLLAASPALAYCGSLSALSALGRIDMAKFLMSPHAKLSALVKCAASTIWGDTCVQT